MSLFTYAERVNSHYGGSSNVIKVISTHKLDIHPLLTSRFPSTQQSCIDSSVIRSLTALFVVVVVVIVTVIPNLLCRTVCTVWSGLVSSSAFTRMWKISLCIGNQVFGFTCNSRCVVTVRAAHCCSFLPHCTRWPITRPFLGLREVEEISIKLTL